MFYKKGSISPLIETKIVSVNEWNTFKTSSIKDSVIEPHIVTAMDDDSVYIHGTILASVDLENGSKYFIVKEAEKFINDNADCFPRDEVLKDYKTFKKHAKTYVEHDQSPEKVKGRCIDVVARDMGDTILVDVLFSVDKRHADLIHSLKKGYVNTLSMGCQTTYTICSVCGNIAHNEKEHCTHIKSQKGHVIKADDGKMRKVAEVCYGNTWVDVSIVSNPAFTGAVLRKIISKDEASRKVLSTLLQKSMTQTAIRDGVLKVASKQSLSSEQSQLTEIARILITASGGITIQPISNINDVEEQRKTIETDEYYPYHPIVNTTSEDDLSINDYFAPIPWDNPLDVKDDFDKGNPGNETQIEGPISNPIKVSMWKCHKCNHEKESWLIKSACIDDKTNIYKCEKCGFIEELDIFEDDVIENAINEIQEKISDKWNREQISQYIQQNYPAKYQEIMDTARVTGLLT